MAADLFELPAPALQALGKNRSSVKLQIENEPNNVFSQKREALRQHALAFFQQRWLQKTDRASQHTAVTPALELAAHSTMAATIKALYQRKPGIVIGGGRSPFANKKFLIDNMSLLREQGVQSLYVERLLSDDDQRDLDRCLKFPDRPLPQRLEKKLNYLDLLDHGVTLSKQEPYSLVNLVKEASKAGVRVFGIDCATTYLNQTLDNSSGENPLQRMVLYFAKQIIERHTPENSGAKFIVLGNTIHQHGLEGDENLASLVKATSLRIDFSEQDSLRPDPGITLPPGSGHYRGHYRKEEFFQTEGLLLLKSSEKAFPETLDGLRRPNQIAVDTEGQEIQYYSKDGNLYGIKIQQQDSKVYLQYEPWRNVHQKRYARLEDLVRALQAEGLTLITTRDTLSAPLPPSAPPVRLIATDVNYFFQALTSNSVARLNETAEIMHDITHWPSKKLAELFKMPLKEGITLGNVLAEKMARNGTTPEGIKPVKDYLRLLKRAVEHQKMSADEALHLLLPKTGQSQSFMAFLAPYLVEGGVYYQLALSKQFFSLYDDLFASLSPQQQQQVAQRLNSQQESVEPLGRYPRELTGLMSFLDRLTVLAAGAKTNRASSNYALIQNLALGKRSWEGNSAAPVRHSFELLPPPPPLPAPKPNAPLAKRQSWLPAAGSRKGPLSPNALTSAFTAAPKTGVLSSAQLSPSFSETSRGAPLPSQALSTSVEDSPAAGATLQNNRSPLERISSLGRLAGKTRSLFRPEQLVLYLDHTPEAQAIAEKVYLKAPQKRTLAYVDFSSQQLTVIASKGKNSIAAGGIMSSSSMPVLKHLKAVYLVSGPAQRSTGTAEQGHIADAQLAEGVLNLLHQAGSSVNMLRRIEMIGSRFEDLQRIKTVEAHWKAAAPTTAGSSVSFPKLSVRSSPLTPNPKSTPKNPLFSPLTRVSSLESHRSNRLRSSSSEGEIESSANAALAGRSSVALDRPLTEVRPAGRGQLPRFFSMRLKRPKRSITKEKPEQAENLSRSTDTTVFARKVQLTVWDPLNRMGTASIEKLIDTLGAVQSVNGTQVARQIPASLIPRLPELTTSV